MSKRFSNATWLLVAYLMLPPHSSGAQSGKASTAATDPSPPASHQLDVSTFERWRDYIRPKPEELEWMKIGWRPRLAQAVIEAQQRDKPILIWAMTGNPCGYT